MGEKTNEKKGRYHTVTRDNPRNFFFLFFSFFFFNDPKATLQQQHWYVLNPCRTKSLFVLDKRTRKNVHIRDVWTTNEQKKEQNFRAFVIMFARLVLLLLMHRGCDCCRQSRFEVATIIIHKHIIDVNTHTYGVVKKIRYIVYNISFYSNLNIY